MVELGATGNFPDGKIHESDEGELAMAIATDPKKKVVIVEFGKAVKWMGLDKSSALEFGRLLIKKAEEL